MSAPPISLDRQKVESLSALFALAENTIKRIELRGNCGLFVPSINELRYVAYHLFALLNEEKPSSSAHWQKIENHINRAIYDGHEALILFELEDYQSFKKDYQLISVSEVVPHYLSLCKEAESIKRQIESSARSEDDRERDYAQIMPMVDKIKDINLTLDSAREELNKKSRQAQNERMRWLLGTIIALTGLIFAFVSLLD